jgi:hypothetical protein
MDRSALAATVEDVLPDYWVTVFPGEVDPGWTA